jgi:hypothetical protein
LALSSDTDKILVTFASSVFSNATLPVAELYHVSTEVTTLGTSLFVLGFAVGPLVRTFVPTQQIILLIHPSDMGSRF